MWPGCKINQYLRPRMWTYAENIATALWLEIAKALSSVNVKF